MRCLPLTLTLSLRERGQQWPTLAIKEVVRIADRLTGIPHLPHGLSSPTSQAVEFVNPEGIPSLSPGLRGTSYPGFARLEDQPTPSGLYPAPSDTDTTPLGLRPNYHRFPRVARASQPWAELFNPFGIARPRASKLWVMIRYLGEGRGEGVRRASCLKHQDMGGET